MAQPADRRTAQLVRLVLAHPGLNPPDLAARLGVSTRTLRTRVRLASEELEGIALVELRRGCGYALRMRDEAALAAWMAQAADAGLASMPSTPADRVLHLLCDLLGHDGWVTLGELSGRYYVSKSSLSADLGQVSSRIAPYGLVLERRPRHGIHVAGDGLARRLCLASVRRLGSWLADSGPGPGACAKGPSTDRDDEDKAAPISGPFVSGAAWEVAGAMVAEAQDAYGVELGRDLELRVNLACHVMAFGARIRDGIPAKNPLAQLVRDRDPTSWRMARDACAVLSGCCGAPVSEAEAGYVATSLALALGRLSHGQARRCRVLACSPDGTAAHRMACGLRRDFGKGVSRVEECGPAQVRETDIAGVDYVFSTAPLECAVPLPLCLV